jgi:hypothetical protein
MSTFGQVVKSGTKGRRQLWLICGSEKAFVQDAYEMATAHVCSGVESVSKTVFLGGETTGPQLRSRLLESVERERSFVVLFDAEKFTGWNHITDILSTLPKSDFFVAVSNSNKIDDDAPYLALFKNSPKVRYVVCNPITSDVAVQWIQSRLEISSEAARYLVSHSKGDSEWLLNTMRKLETFNLSEKRITLGTVEMLCKSTGVPDFSKSLLYYRKQDAIMSICNKNASKDTMLSIVDTVRKAALLHEIIKAVGFGTRKILERAKFSLKDYEYLKPLAKIYDKGNTLSVISTTLASYETLDDKRWRWLSLVARW